jgi:hypothetical protein
MNAGRRPANNVIPLRAVKAGMTPKQLQQLQTFSEMQRQYNEFWRKRAPQQQRAMKPRNIARNRRIHTLAAEGKPVTVIIRTLKAEGFKAVGASQVRKILAKPAVRVVSEK